MTELLHVLSPYVMQAKQAGQEEIRCPECGTAHADTMQVCSFYYNSMTGVAQCVHCLTPVSQDWWRES